MAGVYRIQCVDHRGTVFPSIYKMCKAWGVNYDTFRMRRKTGHSLEESLTGKNIGSSHKSVDYNGRTFPSLNAMCKYHNVPVTTFITRRSKGWSLKDCLDNKANKK